MGRAVALDQSDVSHPVPMTEPASASRADQTVHYLVCAGVATAFGAFVGADETLPHVAAGGLAVGAVWLRIARCARVVLAAELAAVAGVFVWSMPPAVPRSLQVAPHGTECGNHLQPYRAAFRGYGRLGDERYPEAESALDALDAIFTRTGRPRQRSWLDGGGGECAGCRGVGLVWVGAGLPVRLAHDLDALLFVCPASNRHAYEHVHAMTGRGLACETASGVITRLEQAIVHGDTGIVPYTPAAMAKLKSELQARRDYGRSFFRGWW